MVNPTTIVTIWFLVFGVWLIALPFLVDAHWRTFVIVLSTYALADAGSYLFHYIVDHYGRADRPGVVREFQNHHREPGYIAQRPLSEVLEPAARIITPWLVLVLILALIGWLPGPLALFLFTLGSCWVFTQLFHRWSHLRDPGPLIGLLQRVGLIVGREAHTAHHRTPFMSHFAVINGWSNPLFDAIRMPLIVDYLLVGLLGIRKRSTLVEDMARFRVEKHESA